MVGELQYNNGRVQQGIDLYISQGIWSSTGNLAVQKRKGSAGDRSTRSPGRDLRMLGGSTHMDAVERRRGKLRPTYPPGPGACAVALIPCPLLDSRHLNGVLAGIRRRLLGDVAARPESKSTATGPDAPAPRQSCESLTTTGLPALCLSSRVRLLGRG